MSTFPFVCLERKICGQCLKDNFKNLATESQSTLRSDNPQVMFLRGTMSCYLLPFKERLNFFGTSCIPKNNNGPVLL